MTRSAIVILILIIVRLTSVNLYAQSDPVPGGTKNVKQDPTFHKEINGFSLSLTSEQMTYLLDNLFVASILLNEYGIHTLRIRETGPGRFHAEDESGLEGVFGLIGEGGREPGAYTVREYAGHGWISSRAITTISADVVARIGFEETYGGTTKNDLEFWVCVDGLLLDILCRIFRPLLLSILTKKFDDFILVVQRFTGRLQEDPSEACGILQKRGVGEPEIVEFTRVFSLP
ncbi:MAG: hypothetical protein JXQ30_12250 [Spirochaetes bacterium]|nr:hypothetical protein [Spirochaetota bacterium]